MFKMINKAGHITKAALEAFQGAYVAGGAHEVIIFPGAYANDHKFKRVTAMMDSINLAWYEFNEDLYVIRRWFDGAVSDRSEAALAELKSIIR